MAGPYREGGSRNAPAPLEDAGIVGDLVDQFADPLAFYRELVQNAIDAGTNDVHVSLHWDEGMLRVAVRDGGEGMDPEIIQDRLLVLFRSGKEDQKGKIGKFGVGFVSVLAMDPHLVTVSTSRGTGHRWVLQLRADHSYELYEEPSRAGAGTTVSIEVSLDADALDDFVTRSEATLRRWCRHAAIPIRFRAVQSGARRPLRDTRIDEPLGVEGWVSVAATSEDGATRVVVGIPKRAPYAGFFNQGLLLYETDEPLLGRLCFKVLDGRLEHTLSRDNVRRDASFDRAIAFVRKIARGPLVAAVLADLANAATERTKDFSRRLDAALASGLPVPPRDVVLPLLEPLDGKTSRPVRALRDAVRASASTALTRALAKTSRPVLVERALVLRGRKVQPEGLAVLERALGTVEVARTAFVLVQPADVAGDDALLLDRLETCLAEVHRRPSALLFARLEGAGDDRMCIAGGRPDDPWLVDARASRGSPFRLVARPPLVLNVAHPLVDVARSRAADSPVLAAGLLARGVLLTYALLDDKRDGRWIDHALDTLLDASRRTPR